MSPDEVVQLFEAFKKSLTVDELAEFSSEIQAFSDLIASGTADVADQAAALDRLRESVKQAAQETERARKSQQDFTNALQRTLRTFTGLTDGSETLIGSFMNMEKSSRKLQKEIDELEEKMGDASLTAEELAEVTEQHSRKQREQEQSTKSV